MVGESKKYDKVWKEDWKDITDYGPSYRTRYRLIKKLMRKYGLVKGVLLDAGCGDGTLLLALKKRFPKLNLFGFDISEEVIKRHGDKIKLSAGDLKKANTLPKKRFDIIICSELLEHLDDYKTAIKNMSDLLKKGGYIIISSPYRMKHWTIHDEYAQHIRRWEDDMIEPELKKNRIKILESFSWGRIIYKNYYRHFLAKQDPRKLLKHSFFKRKIMANILYNTFKVDDFFKSNGRTLFIVGRKN